jgi:hypothetical protein
MVSHDIGHTIRIVRAVDLDRADAEPPGVTDRVVGDQPVALDPPPLRRLGAGDRPRGVATAACAARPGGMSRPPNSSLVLGRRD